MTTEIAPIKAKEIISEAWQLTKGFKGKFWVPSSGLIVAMLVVQFMLYHFMPENQAASSSRAGLLLKCLVGALVNAPFMGGITMIAIMRVRGQTISYTTWTHYSKYFINVALVLFLLSALMRLPVLIRPEGHNTISPSFFGVQILMIVVVAFSIQTAVYFLIDKKVNPLQACGLSVKLMLSNLRVTLPVFLFIMLIFVVSAVLAGIPFIWVYPFIVLLIANLYVKLS
jgi:uncharacterized membrane protein